MHAMRVLCGRQPNTFPTTMATRTVSWKPLWHKIICHAVTRSACHARVALAWHGVHQKHYKMSCTSRKYDVKVSPKIPTVSYSLNIQYLTNR